MWVQSFPRRAGTQVPTFHTPVPSPAHLHPKVQDQLTSALRPMSARWIRAWLMRDEPKSPLPFPPPEEGPPPEAPRQVACGACELGAERCLSARSREVCAEDGQGYVPWRAATGCAADRWCSRGTCSEANPCRRPVLEACLEDGQRTCVSNVRTPAGRGERPAGRFSQRPKRLRYSWVSFLGTQ